MSYAYNGMTPVRSRDPRTVIKEDTHYVARQGGSDVTFTTVSANSSSNNQTSFKISVPSTNTLLSRLIYLTQDFTIVFTSSAKDVNGGTVKYPIKQFLSGLLPVVGGIVDSDS